MFRTTSLQRLINIDKLYKNGKKFDIISMTPLSVSNKPSAKT